MARRALPPPAAGKVRFRAAGQPQLRCSWELDGPVTPTGYGGHAVTSRTGEVGLTSYQGRDPLALSFPLVLDRRGSQQSIEPDISMLERFYGIRPSDPRARPVKLIVEGRGVPHSYERRPNLRWVLTGDPEWGEQELQANGSGRRVFQQLTLVALCVTRPDEAAVDELDPDDGTPKMHVVRREHRERTLREIARHHALSHHALMVRNARVAADPDQPLKPGTKVSLR